MKSRNNFEVMIWGITSISQIFFYLMFLFETNGGQVEYAEWKDVDGILKYSTRTYQAASILAIGVLVVILFELLLTIWGIYSKSYFAGFGTCTGMVLYFGMFIQVFYNNGENLRKHILFSVIGILAMIFYYFLIRIKPNRTQGIYIRIAIVALLGANLLAMIINLLKGENNNGAYAWVQFWGISFQPGEFIKILIILLSAWVFKYRDDKKMTRMYLIYCITSVFVLVVARDLGNAVVLLVICLISSWFIYDKWIYTFFAFGVGSVGIVLAGKYIPYVRNRFEKCFHALEQGEGQQFRSLMAIIKSGISGCGPAGNTVNVTFVTSSANDLTFNSFLAIWGILLTTVLVVCVAGMFVQMLITTVVSPFHYLLGVLGVTTIFTQFFIHVGGSLNIIPFTGICANFISSGGSNLVCSFMLIAGILVSMAPGYEVVTIKLPRKNKEFDLYDYKNSHKKMYSH